MEIESSPSRPSPLRCPRSAIISLFGRADREAGGWSTRPRRSRLASSISCGDRSAATSSHSLMRRMTTRDACGTRSKGDDIEREVLGIHEARVAVVVLHDLSGTGLGRDGLLELSVLRLLGDRELRQHAGGEWAIEQNQVRVELLVGKHRRERRPIPQDAAKEKRGRSEQAAVTALSSPAASAARISGIHAHLRLRRPIGAAHISMRPMEPRRSRHAAGDEVLGSDPPAAGAAMRSGRPTGPWSGRAPAGTCRAPDSYRVRGSVSKAYLNLKFARWSVPSASFTVSCRQVPAHVLSVFQT